MIDYLRLSGFIDRLVMTLTKMLTMNGSYISLNRGYAYCKLLDTGHDDCFQTFWLNLLTKKETKYWFLMSKRQNYEKFTSENKNIPMS
jgi:hypothetical protein